MHSRDDDSTEVSREPSALPDRWTSQPSAFNGRDEPDLPATIALAATFALGVGSVVFVVSLVLGGLVSALLSLLIVVAAIGSAFVLRWLE